MQDNRKSLAQNFIAKSHLAALLLKQSSIGLNDIVYEIGPGSGMLTRELVKKSKKVIAIEKDYNLYAGLKKKFDCSDNLMLFNTDFLKFKIKEPCYKIFANIPFNITAAVIRKIVYLANPPNEAYLVLQKEAAEKFAGISKTTQFSVLIKPWFQIKIIRYFRHFDFSPVPKVDVVMLHLAKRVPALISARDIQVYERFIKYVFGAWHKDLKANFGNIFSYTQWKRLAHELGFRIHAIPSELSFRQWLGLFEFFRKNIHIK